MIPIAWLALKAAAATAAIAVGGVIVLHAYEKHREFNYVIDNNDAFAVEYVSKRESINSLSTENKIRSFHKMMLEEIIDKDEFKRLKLSLF